LKIVLVNLNYRIGVHMKFAQSLILALVCSPQSEYGCHKGRSQGEQRGHATQFQSFQVNKIFEV